MKNLSFLLLVFLVSLPCFAREDPRIIDIRREYYKIRNEYSSMSSYNVSLEGQSTEGGEATGYLDSSKKIRLIEVALYFESGKQLKEYYFKDAELFFVFTKSIKYNVPMYIDHEKAKELNIEPFDIKKSKTRENRYYFSDSKLIRWLGENNKKMELDSKTTLDQEHRLLGYSKATFTEVETYIKTYFIY